MDSSKPWPIASAFIAEPSTESDQETIPYADRVPQLPNEYRIDGVCEEPAKRAD
jgi:hypothetical protein